MMASARWFRVSMWTASRSSAPPTASATSDTRASASSTDSAAPVSIALTTTLHLFSGLFSRTTWISRYQKGKTSLDLNEARGNGVLGWQWHQLDHANNLHLAPD